MPKSNIQHENTPYRGIQRVFNKDWSIEAYSLQRTILKHTNIDNLNNLGITENSIYFLVGEDDKLKVYIGRASEDRNKESAIRRIMQHALSTTEWYLWTQMIFLHHSLA